MNKKITALLLAAMIMTATACQSSDTLGSKKEAENQEYLKKIEFSNINDEQTVKEVQNVMQEAGITKERQKLFFDSVKYFNESIKKEHLTTGFEIMNLGEMKYEPFTLQEEWSEKNPDFEGYNCRITSFGLFSDLVEVDKNAPKNEDWIRIDLMSLSSHGEVTEQEGELDRFKVLFSSIETEPTQDINVHIKKIQEDWKNRDIKFKTGEKASLITVFFHDDLDETNKLFIGHVGVLFQKSKDELYFVEKIAFQEPYQVTKFKNRTELNDYLMNKYDVEWGQTAAKPFIMENDKLLEGYRPNPNNKGEESSAQ